MPLSALGPRPWMTIHAALDRIFSWSCSGLGPRASAWVLRRCHASTQSRHGRCRASTHRRLRPAMPRLTAACGECLDAACGDMPRLTAACAPRQCRSRPSPRGPRLSAPAPALSLGFFFNAIPLLSAGLGPNAATGSRPRQECGYRACGCRLRCAAGVLWAL